MSKVKLTHIPTTCATVFGDWTPCSAVCNGGNRTRSGEWFTASMAVWHIHMPGADPLLDCMLRPADRMQSVAEWWNRKRAILVPVEVEPLTVTSIHCASISDRLCNSQAAITRSKLTIKAHKQSLAALPAVSGPPPVTKRSRSITAAILNLESSKVQAAFLRGVPTPTSNSKRATSNAGPVRTLPLRNESLSDDCCLLPAVMHRSERILPNS